ncbi:hypothetical protein GGR51DRAFT_241513 [Nemania sp. FL0031]|nr:hypothetical protein GGR51DRAFT_241513 [Nemania sp. FL0031]
MELDAHQMIPEPFGAYGYHMRRSQDLEMSGRPRHLPSAASAPSSPPSRYTLTRDASRCVDGSIKSPCDSSRPGAPGFDTRPGSKSWPPSPRSHGSPQKEARQHEPSPGISKAGTTICERLEKAEEEVGEETRAIVSLAKPAPAAAVATPFQLSLPLRPQNAKRIRTQDDVDGPGTAELAVKKRRLLLHLVTSRLSRPFSLPATHILIRESSDNMPVLHRIQQLAATTLGARRAGHQSALVRKAAILNRVRIGVRQAAVSRGHTIMAEIAARGSALNHGLLLVTTPAAGNMGAMFPVVGKAVDSGGATPRGSSPGSVFLPPVWRPHTTSFHPPIAPENHQQHTNHHSQNYNYSYGVNTVSDVDTRHTSISPVPQTCTSAAAQHYMARANPHRHKEPHVAEPARSAPRQHGPPPVPHPHPHPHPHTPAEFSDEEDNTAFPAASFRDRYADLSDDDMDDVYADFGVLFGSGARSPEARTGPAGPVEEQFYEEYLDELDGIPWIA